MRRFWWPGLSEDVRQYVRSCLVCRAQKIERALPVGDLYSFEYHYSLELVALDSLDTLPKSLSGKCHVLIAIDCSTRFVDAEATFVRQHCNRSNIVDENHGPCEVFYELRELKEKQMHGDAIGNQSAARLSSRKHYNRRHRSHQFAIRELVWARVMGRSSKFQNSFVGPYLITMRNNDIYKFISETRRETLSRHVNDLKPYVEREPDTEPTCYDEKDKSDGENNADGGAGETHINSPQPSTSHQLNSTQNQSTSAINSTLSISQFSINLYISIIIMDKKFIIIIVFSLLRSSWATENIIFPLREAPLVQWHPEERYVSPHITMVKLTNKFVSPCSVHLQFNVPGSHTDLSQAMQLCDQIFKRYVTGRVHAVNTKRFRPVQQLILPPGQAPEMATNQIGQQAASSSSGSQSNQFSPGSVANRPPVEQFSVASIPKQFQVD